VSKLGTISGMSASSLIEPPSLPSRAMVVHPFACAFSSAALTLANYRWWKYRTQHHHGQQALDLPGEDRIETIIIA